MWQRVFDYTRQLFKLKEQTEKNAADIKEIQQALRELTLIVQRLAFEVERQREKQTDEQEKMALRLENILLRSGRGLLSGTTEADATREELERQITILKQENEELRKQIAPD